VSNPVVPKLPHLVIPAPQVRTTGWRPPHRYFKVYTATDMRGALLDGWIAAHLHKSGPAVSNPQFVPQIQLHRTQINPTFTVAGKYIQLHGHPIARLRIVPKQKAYSPSIQCWLVLRRYPRFAPSQRSVLQHLPQFRDRYLAAPGAKLDASPKALLKHNFGLLEQSILKAHRARTDASRQLHRNDATIIWNRLRRFAQDYKLQLPEFSEETSKLWVAMKIADQLTATPSMWFVPDSI
jgi:hypothetical protein